MSKTQIDAPAGVPFVDITREFDAPLELVRRAWTDPDLVKQWLGPRKYEMVIEQWDARAGGGYRSISRRRLRLPHVPWRTVTSVA